MYFTLFSSVSFAECEQVIVCWVDAYFLDVNELLLYLYELCMTGLSMSKVVHVRRGFSACDSYVNVRIHK